MKKNKILLLVALLVTSFGFSQEILTKQEAFNIALENNYGIKVANNNTERAKNNASILNSSFLPSVVASGNANYSLNNTDLTNRDGSHLIIDGAESKSISTSLGLNYTLFDGLGRSYNFRKLKETYNFTELETQTIVENTMLQLFALYYEVAKLTEDTSNISESLTISKKRLERAMYGFDFGQNTKLDILNAEVDVNNDSINLTNIQRNLSNAKRDLNLALGRDINTPFVIEIDTDFSLVFELESLLEKAKMHNVEMLKAEKNIELSNFDVKISKSDLFPTLGLNTSYAFSSSRNDASIFIQQESNGFNAGINLTWNIFDGGLTKTRIQNSKIQLENLEIQKKQIEQELERNVSNALEVFNNALFVMKAEEKNVETNKRNFLRTEEQYKLGQVTSIEFRQAQLNLLNAKSNLIKATYDAKNAELVLLQLSGELLNTSF